ncbi:hypothetical protein GGX14DRAFT_578876 [Mycena pura]|uniref:Uncharacterized protein n=1 Tax=Mycena pura TaxID=153505 RepID=A0AAD6UNV2_9AGAR|nr:hypothetical protein GGX14DRAFT_578876 [Mycena pura]
MLAPEIHRLESLKVPGAWPLAISRTFDLLELPVPSQCSEGRHSTSLLRERSGVLAKPSEDLLENSTLHDFYHFASHTVATVNSAMCHHGPRSTWLFVRGFTKVLAAICCENTTILSFAPFVRPRIIPPDNRFDGIAEMLACHIVESFEGDSSMLGDEKSSHFEAASFAPSGSNAISNQNSQSNKTSNRENRRKIRDCDPAETSVRGSVSDPTSAEESNSREIPDPASSFSLASEPSIDVSLDGHIFLGRGKHSQALLPFLCIADAENIFELVASVACQRYVWGISEPAIGFLSPSSGAVLELVLSYHGGFQRTLHIAHSINQQPGPGIGSFDFGSVTSTLRFSQFIFNLSPSFHAVASDASRLYKNNKLDWRSDNPKLGDFETRPHRVAQWVRDVQLFYGPESLPRVPSQPPSARSDSELHMDNPSTKSSRSSDNSAHTKDSTGSIRSEPLKSHSLDVTISAREGSVPSSQTGKSRLSSSSLAEKSVNKKAADQPHLLTYTFDRLLRFLTLVAHPKDLFGDEGAEITEKFGLYTEMTAFQWFPSLTEDPFPDVAGVLLPYKHALLKKATDNTVPLFDPQSQSIPETSTLNRITKLYKYLAYEAESRHDWDALLYCFCVANEEIVSPNVLLERTIRHPKNILAEEEDISKLAATVTAEARSSIAFYLNAQLNAAKSAPSDFYTQALLASTQANDPASSYQKYCGTVDRQQQLQQLIQHRSLSPPGPPSALIRPADVAALEFMKYVRHELKADAATTIKTEDNSSRLRGTGDDKEKTGTNEEKTTKKGKGSGSGAPDIDLNAANRKRFLQNPFTVSKDLSSAAVDAMPELRVPEFDASSIEGKLLFPHLVIEYKKRDDTEAKALNQGRMYLISLISFYAAPTLRSILYTRSPILRSGYQWAKGCASYGMEIEESRDHIKDGLYKPATLLTDKAEDEFPDDGANEINSDNEFRE